MLRGMTFRELRDKARLSQAQLAAAAGVDQTTISQIETGKVRDPRYGTVSALAEVLGTTTSVLAAVIARGEAA
jgi:transcriptional regulator with XRE-family HTH domain